MIASECLNILDILSCDSIIFRAELWLSQIMVIWRESTQVILLN